MTKVSITGIKPLTPFGLPEYFVQATGQCPRTHWSAKDAMNHAIALGLHPDEAWKQILEAMKIAAPEVYEKNKTLIEGA